MVDSFIFLWLHFYGCPTVEQIKVDHILLLLENFMAAISCLLIGIDRRRNKRYANIFEVEG